MALRAQVAPVSGVWMEPSAPVSEPEESPEALPRPSLRPFFGFYGGKWRDSLKHFPPPASRTIVEPFAGSAGYSVRYANRRIVLAELDPEIASVWRFLIHTTPKEILSIPDIADGQSVADLKICPEARSLVGFWLNRAASSPRKKPSKWMREGIRPGSFWGDRVRSTIASQLESIRHWEIHNCSYDQVPVQDEATWFIDPPYESAGRHYRYGASLIEYDKLAQWCRSRSGQVIVCENDGADWLPFRELATVKTTRAARRSKEVYWLNTFEEPTEPSR